MVNEIDLFSKLDIIKKVDEAKKEFDNFASINNKLKTENDSLKNDIKVFKDEANSAKEKLDILLKDINDLELKKKSLANGTSDIVVEIQKKVSIKEKELSLLEESLKEKELLLNAKEESLLSRGKELTNSQIKLDNLLKENDDIRKSIQFQLDSAKKHSDRCVEKSIVVEDREKELLTLISKYNKDILEVENEKNNYNILRESLIKQEQSLSFRESQLSDKEREYKLNQKENAAKLAELEKTSKELDSKLKGLLDFELQVKAQEAKLNSIIRKKDLQDAIKAA